MKKLSSQDKVIHDQFSRYGKNAKEWMNKCVLMLPKIEKNRIWEKKGFGSIYEYAAKIAGMSRHKVDDSLRIIRQIGDKPKLMNIAKQKGLNSVRPIVTITTKTTENFWAKKALQMGKNTLAVYVKDYKKEQISTSEPSLGNSRPGTGSPLINGFNKANAGSANTIDGTFAKPSNDVHKSKVQISMKLDAKLFASLKKLKGDGDWNTLMEKLLKYSQEELEKEKEIFETAEKRFQEELAKEKPASVKAKNHRVTAAIRKYICKRSKGQCEHPNCSKAGKHIHHINPYALKKEHDPDKLLYLCEEHHQIIHLGYINDEVQSLNQVNELPSYDIKNLINHRIAEFKNEAFAKT